MPVEGLLADLTVKQMHHRTSAFPDMAKSSPNMLHISVQRKKKKFGF